MKIYLLLFLFIFCIQITFENKTNLKKSRIQKNHKSAKNRQLIKKQKLIEFARQLQEIKHLPNDEQIRITRILLKILKNKAERKTILVKNPNDRKLVDLMSSALALGGGAAAMFLTSFLTERLELSRLKKKWRNVQHRVLFSNSMRKRKLESLGGHIAMINNEVGLFGDQIETRAAQLRNFVDARMFF